MTWRRQDGQAIVELALVLPVLLLLLVGILKFGLLYNNYITLTDSVRVGARSLSLGRGLHDPCTPALDADEEQRGEPQARPPAR